MFDLARPAWWDEAACLGENDGRKWFPSQGQSTQPAKETCAVCPVKDTCLDYALVRGEKFGIWGGMSERQRLTLRRQRARSGTMDEQRMAKAQELLRIVETGGMHVTTNQHDSINVAGPPAEETELKQACREIIDYSAEVRHILQTRVAPVDSRDKLQAEQALEQAKTVEDLLGPDRSGDGDPKEPDPDDGDDGDE